LPRSRFEGGPGGAARGERAEVQLLYGIHPVLEALRARRRRLLALRLRSGAARPELAPVLEAARAAGVRIEERSAAELAKGLGEGANHQGVVLQAGPLPELDLAGICAAGPSARTLVALDHVEDPQNLGAIARVADAAGVNGLLLTDRHSPPLSPAVARASAGAIEWLATARVTNLVRALNQLKSQGFWIFGAEADAPDSLFELPERVVRGERVVVLGAEGRGLRPGVRAAVDHRVRIPLAGRVASLNVASAAAVILFELARRSHPAGTGGPGPGEPV
jgi:23S rRNA (guanosine2251-2'-O)-methyltransferase